MARIKFTVKGLDSLVAKAHPARVDYFDVSTPGLCLRVGPRSAAWTYLQRIDGKLTRMTLGTYPAMSLREAHEAVVACETTIAEGKHPKAEQARERAAKRDARTVDHERIGRTVAEAWAAHHFPTIGPATRADYRRALDGFIADFGDDDIGSIRRGQLVRHLDAVKARKRKGKSKTAGTAANRAAVVIRNVFAFARDRYDLDANPAADIKNPTKQTKRSRTLDRHELRIVWHACELAGYPYGHALRLAICTAQRIGEVGAMQRDHVDSSGDYWQQADNKSRRRIDLYLADHARAILDSCPNFGADAPYFSASGGEAEEGDDVKDKDKKKPRRRGLRSDTWANALKRHILPRLAASAKELRLPAITKPWTPHDLRRTVRTALTGWCGVSPDTAERVLNHAMGGLREVYDHADYRPHVATALQRWDQELGAILKGKASTVIPLSRSKRRTG
jgi:integrase